MTDDKHMELWSSVEKTNPKHVKKITGKAYQGDSPNPYAMVMKATERFGPCGIGWGFRILKEEIVDGALLAPGFFQRHHKATVQVWYIWNNQKGEVEHIGQTEFSGLRASGKPFTDEDACKKSVTDALSKALSMLGFAGDIFMGRWDDSKYQAELRREFSGQGKADAAVAAAAQKVTPATTPMELVAQIGGAESLAELNAIIHNQTNIAVFQEATDEAAATVEKAIAARRAALSGAKQPAKETAKQTAAAKHPPEKAPVASDTGHVDPGTYDDEASGEASTAMIKDLQPVLKLIEMEELTAAKVSLQEWVGKHKIEKGHLIAEDKSIVEAAFRDAQTAIRSKKAEIDARDGVPAE